MTTAPVAPPPPLAELSPEEEQALLAHPMLEGVLPLHETSDMVLVIRLRRIIEGKQTGLAQVLMKHYRFWYHDKMHETSQVFWTENHFIMSQSSEHLLREFLGLSIPPSLHYRLGTYLNLKLTLGLAEFLSPVYYPFTIASLLNLFDFTHSPTIRTKCQQLLDLMAHQVLSVCLPDGSFVSPSGRSYARHRRATTGHHLSFFIDYIITRTNIPSPPDAPESALREAVKTTSYLPSEWVYANYKALVTDVEIPLSPTWKELSAFLDARREGGKEQGGREGGMPLDERVSTLWSYGAYFHPQAVLEIIPFMDETDLWKHPHFEAAAPARKFLGLWCPACGLRGCLTCMSHSCLIKPLVMGALLTGAQLAVHKEGNVLLSSLVGGFNAGLPAFQQWPWAVNLAGIPIWCTFGPVEAGSIGRRLGNASAGAEMSTARVTPFMKQEKNVLHAVYSSASCGLAWWNRNLRPCVRWPLEEMEETGSLLLTPFRDKPSFFSTACCSSRRPDIWRWGRKGTAVVAWTVRRLEVTVVVRDLKAAECSMTEFLVGLKEEFEGGGRREEDTKGEGKGVRDNGMGTS
ncbi:hypothetical protein VYU27_004920 [Nannochloropsis oceanica]